MQIASHVHDFLLGASNAASCTPHQLLLFTQLRQRCVDEFRAVINKLFFVLATTLDLSSPALSEEMKALGDSRGVRRDFTSPDTVRVLWSLVHWPLRLIVSSDLSSDWQKETARSALEQTNRKVGIVRSYKTQ